ncbi:MAG TPA: hypothetical protein VHC67_01605 [Gaiellaceae bacterium]|jgi:hypothetical protein|nr:hypothetical protein [Gaiellaceae bacterium]
MSNIHTSGAARTLPFTGLATLPILILGAIISGIGFVLTAWRSPKSARNI